MSQHNSIDPDLIVFGGSFDPPHMGHNELALLAHRRFPEAKLLVVPAFSPVVRQGAAKASHATFGHRLAMTKLAWRREIAQGWLTVSDLEQKLPVPSYTLRTLTSLAKGEKRLALLLGLDQLKSYPQWHQPLAILGMSDLIIGSRLPSSAEIRPPSAIDSGQNPDAVITEIANCVSALKLTGEWNPETQQYSLDGLDHVIHFAGTVSWPVSSTDIRTLVEAGETVPADWVSEEVAEYFKSHGLYQREKGLKAQ